MAQEKQSFTAASVFLITCWMDLQDTDFLILQ